MDGVERYEEKDDVRFQKCRIKVISLFPCRGPLRVNG